VEEPRLKIVGKRRKSVGVSHRVSQKRLLDADAQSRRVPLAAERTVKYLQDILQRVRVSSRRGHRDVGPPIHVSVLEEQALRECVALMELKVQLQRGEVLSRTRER